MSFLVSSMQTVIEFMVRLSICGVFGPLRVLVPVLTGRLYSVVKVAEALGGAMPTAYIRKLLAMGDRNKLGLSAYYIDRRMFCQYQLQSSLFNEKGP
jgi:hypothetical protein